MIKGLRIACLFTLFIDLIHPCVGAINYYQNSASLNLTPTNATFGGAGPNNYLSGSYGSNALAVAGSSLTIKAGFDTDNLKMWVEQLTFNLNLASRAMTNQLTDINGNLKNIVTSISFNPITISIKENSTQNNQFRKIAQGSGGAYGLIDTSLNDVISTALTGSYTAVGPTQTRNGSFSINLTSVYLVLPDFINLSNPGQEVVFSSGLSSNRLNIGIMPNVNLPAIYSVVDDVNLAVGLNLSGFQLDTSVFKLQAIPEPSAFSLVAVGLGGLAMIRRRRA